MQLFNWVLLPSFVHACPFYTVIIVKALRQVFVFKQERARFKTLVIPLMYEQT